MAWTTADWAFPGAKTELFSDIVRARIDLTNASQVRMYAEIGSDYYGPVGSTFDIEFSADDAVTWQPLTQQADVSVPGSRVSAWAAIPSSAQADVIVRAVAENGVGAKIDIKAVQLQVK